jgi:hypothetical protein
MMASKSALRLNVGFAFAVGCILQNCPTMFSVILFLLRLDAMAHARIFANAAADVSDKLL